MKKIAAIAAASLLLASSAGAQQASVKWYGFIRNYFAYDSRESTAGTGDLYFYMPKDESLVEGTDINAIPSFRFLAITSRLGVDVSGYEYQGYKVGAKIETDFYSGVSGVTGTAALRLRQAYATIAKDSRTWKVGQAWHPMAIDLPDIFSLESGVPFGPFSRTPQVRFDADVCPGLSLTAAAIWQMQYTSTGPSLTAASVIGYKYAASASANYIKYGCTPELFLGLNVKSGQSLLKAGADLVSIKPRNYAYDLLTGKATGLVSDRLTTLNWFGYFQTRLGNLTSRTKVTYAQDGSHFNLLGGYGVAEELEDGSWRYTATRTLTGWTTLMYREKNSPLQVQALFGYCRLFGTDEDVIEPGSYGTTFWCKNSADKVRSMFRIQPEVIYNLGKVQLGLEYMMTSVEYGKASGGRKLADTDLHDVVNHRLQAMVKYTF